MIKKYSFFTHRFITTAMFINLTMLFGLAAFFTLWFMQIETLLLWIPVCIFIIIFILNRRFFLSRVYIYHNKIEVKYFDKTFNIIDFKNVEEYRIIQQYRTYYLKLITNKEEINIYTNRRLIKKMNGFIEDDLFKFSFNNLVTKIKVFRWE
jgi:hypothetical protein